MAPMIGTALRPRERRDGHGRGAAVAESTGGAAAGAPPRLVPWAQLAFHELGRREPATQLLQLEL